MEFEPCFLILSFGKRVLERCLLEMRSFLRKKDEISAADLQRQQKKLENLKQRAHKILQQLKTELHEAIDAATIGKHLPANHLCQSNFHGPSNLIGILAHKQFSNYLNMLFCSCRCMPQKVNFYGILQEATGDEHY